MKLVMLRHAESVSNTKKVIDSTFPGTALSDNGINQVESIKSEMAETVSNLNIKTAYCSPFQRTVQTLDELNLDVDVKLDFRIKELAYGQYDLKNIDEKGEYVGKTLERVFSGDNEIRFGVTGENQREMMKRIIGFLIEVIDKDENSLMVSHDTIIYVIHRFYREHMDIDGDIKVKNAEPIAIEIPEGFRDFLTKKLENYIKVTYSPFMLKNKAGISMTTFVPSLELLEDEAISTPLTFPISDDSVVMTLDKTDWWNPLGGHVEEGESWEDTLVRESLEEAGVKISNIRIIGYIVIESIIRLTDKYPSRTIIPMTVSDIDEVEENWESMETKDRGVFKFDEAEKLLAERTDNDQMLEIFQYILKHAK